MGESTKIQWCERTASPWHGCSRVHAGCDNCYAEAMSLRNPATLGVWGDDGTRVKSKTFVSKLRKWNKEGEARGEPVSVFPSICDPFEDRPELVEWRNEMFATIDECTWVRLMLLTKRPENVQRMWPVKQDARPIFPGMPGPLGEPVPCVVSGAHRPNVWLLTSVSDQATADAAIPELLKCRDLAAVLGVSYEPALGPVDWSEWFGTSYHDADDGDEQTGDVPYNHGLDWIIVGSESGHKRRPMDAEWAASTARQCREAGVAFFMKQMEVAGRVTGDIHEFPQNLQIREYPTK